MNFIDIHCHILPGIDDGPDTLDEALAMIEVARQDGISHIFATPHILDGVYDNATEKIDGAFTLLRKKVPPEVTLLFGADVRITPDMIRRVEYGSIPTLSGSGYLLIELPHYALPPMLNELVYGLKQRKITPIITHPERHVLLAGKLAVLAHLRSSGAQVQITGQSVTGGFGREVKKKSLAMIEEGLVDYVASDAHDPKKRPPRLSEAYREVEGRFGRETAQRLFFVNQEKILCAIPQPVAGKRKRYS